MDYKEHACTGNSSQHCEMWRITIAFQGFAYPLNCSTPLKPKSPKKYWNHLSPAKSYSPWIDVVKRQNASVCSIISSNIDFGAKIFLLSLNFSVPPWSLVPLNPYFGAFPTSFLSLKSSSNPFIMGRRPVLNYHTDVPFTIYFTLGESAAVVFPIDNHNQNTLFQQNATNYNMLLYTYS